MAFVPQFISTTWVQSSPTVSFFAVAYVDKDHHINFLLSAADPPVFKRGNPISVNETLVSAHKIALVHWNSGDHKAKDPSQISNQIRIYYITKDTFKIRELCLNSKDGNFGDQQWFFGETEKNVTDVVHKDSPFSAMVHRGVVKLYYRKANGNALSMASNNPGQKPAWSASDVVQDWGAGQ